jgi:hypothetical protein
MVDVSTFYLPDLAGPTRFFIFYDGESGIVVVVGQALP